MARELWKDIKGYKGYQVSNLGDIRSSNGVDQANRSKIISYKALKPYKRNGKGYMAVDLWMTDEKGNAVRNTKFVHTLVATSFFDNRANTETVDHKNYNRQDNSVGNLVFKSRSQNTSEARQRQTTLQQVQKH